MSEVKPWVEPLQIPVPEYAEWTQQAPPNRDFTFWCMETGKLDEGQYLNWAREHYGLASLDHSFFHTSPDLVLWQRVYNVGQWNEAMLPVGEWDGVVFIACVTPPLKDQWSFPVRYILAPPSGMRAAWRMLQQSAKSFAASASTGGDQSESLITTAKLVKEVNTPKPTPPPVMDDGINASIETAKVVISPPSEANPDQTVRMETVPPAIEETLKVPTVDEITDEVVIEVTDEAIDLKNHKAKADSNTPPPSAREDDELFPELPELEQTAPPALEGLDPKVFKKVKGKQKGTSKKTNVEEEVSDRIELDVNTSESADILKGMPDMGDSQVADAQTSGGFTLSTTLDQYIEGTGVNDLPPASDEADEVSAAAPPKMEDLPSEKNKADQATPVAKPAEKPKAPPTAKPEEEKSATPAAKVAAPAEDSSPQVENTSEDVVALDDSQPKAEDAKQTFNQDDIPTAVIEAAKLKEKEAKAAAGIVDEKSQVAIEPVAEEAEAPQESAASDIEGAVCELPEPPVNLGDAKSEDAVASWVFNQMQDKFEKSMILLFEGNKLRPWKWDSPWKLAKAEGLEAFDVSKACVFRVVRRTRLPYHGHLVKNEINEAFFAHWGHEELPKHVTICPIQYDSHLVGMIVSVGSKDCDTHQHLAFAERQTDKLSEAMQKVNSAAA